MPASAIFSGNTILQRNDSNYLTNVVDDDIVLMNLKTGNYLAIQNAGVPIWYMLAEPITLDRIIGNLLDEYDVTETMAREETLAFLKRMADFGVLRILTN